MSGGLVRENKDESYDTYGFGLSPAGKRLGADQIAIELNKETMLVTATEDAKHYVVYTRYNRFISTSSVLYSRSVRCLGRAWEVIHPGQSQ